MSLAYSVRILLFPFFLLCIPQSGWSVKSKPILSKNEVSTEKKVDFITPSTFGNKKQDNSLSHDDWIKLDRKEIEKKLNRRLKFKERWALRILKRSVKRVERLKIKAAKKNTKYQRAEPLTEKKKIMIIVGVIITIVLFIFLISWLKCLPLGCS